MTDPIANRFEFIRHNRTQRAVVILILVYGGLTALIILFSAVWWLVALLALPTLPTLWDVIADTRAGMSLDDTELSWFTGRRSGSLPLSEIEYFRFDTRWDFSVRVSACLASGKRVRLPDESMPPHREFEEALLNKGIRTERHHFRVF